MEKDKLYFRDEDDTICRPLSERLADAKAEDLKTITLFEAVRDKDTKDIIFCSHYGDCVEKSDCNKSICPDYESNSGRGVCSNRGKLYCHGEKITFNVE